MAAASFGAAEAVAVPGSDLALRLLGQLLGGRVAVVGPGYSGHVAMWRSPVTVISVDALGEAAATHDVLVLARPGNPDGTMIARDMLESAAATLAARGGYLIVDESFVDATPEASVAGSGWPGLIVLRSFGKFFGLAGLRLGFVIAPMEIAADLRRLLGDWPVSSPAIAVGTAAYADGDWQAAQRRRLAVASRRLDALLGDAGLVVAGGTNCFRLVATPERDALFDHLASAAILTRPFADQPLRLRFGLPGNEASWTRLTGALEHWRQR